MAVKIYKLGSITGQISSWESLDEGISWTETTNSLPVYSTQYGSLLKVNDSTIMFFAGTNKLTSLASPNYRRVYKSTDNGKTFSAVTSFPEDRSWLSPLFVNGSIYVLGGTGSSINSGVYKSDDLGITWTKISTAMTTYATGFIYYNNKFWRIGGKSSADVASNVVYNSSDAVTWGSIGTLPSSIYNHSTVVFNNKIVVIGGQLDSTTQYNSVISSSDGVNWTTESTPPFLTTANVKTGDIGVNSAFVVDGTLYYLSRHNTSGTSGNVNIYKTTDLINWTSYQTAQTTEVYPMFLVSPQTVTMLDINSSISSVSSVQISLETILIQSIIIGIESLSNFNVQIDYTPVDATYLSANYSSNSNIIIDIALLPALPPLIVSGSMIGQSFISIDISIPSNLVIRGIVTVNGIGIVNAKVFALSDITNSAFIGYSDSQGNYEISVIGNGNYHIFSVFQDSNGNPFSTLVQPYVIVEEVQL